MLAGMPPAPACPPAGAPAPPAPGFGALGSPGVPGSVPAAVLVLAKYQYQGAFVADQEINMLACLTEIMVECEFK